MKKIVCFGDVHGEFFKLKALVEEAEKLYGEVDFYTLGDLIDRGKDSKKVIQLCVDKGMSGVYGNHEEWLINLIRNGIFDSFALEPIMGGKRTFESYGVVPSMDIRGDAEMLLNLIPDTHKKWLLSLKPHMSISSGGKTYRLIHAGLTKSNARSYMADSDSDDNLLDDMANTPRGLTTLLWSSPRVSSTAKTGNLYEFKDGSVQIFGHKPVGEAFITNSFIALDTGCGTCHPFNLSAVVLPDEVILSHYDIRKSEVYGEGS